MKLRGKNRFAKPKIPNKELHWLKSIFPGAKTETLSSMMQERSDKLHILVLQGERCMSRNTVSLFFLSCDKSKLNKFFNLF